MKEELRESTNLYNPLRIAPEIKVAKHKVGDRHVDAVLLESFQGVDQSTPSTLAVHRRKLFAGGQVRGVMEQMDVDHVHHRALDVPAGSQEALARPSALGEKVLREFRLLLARHRLYVAGMDHLVGHRFPLVCHEVPHIQHFDGV